MRAQYEIESAEWYLEEAKLCCTKFILVHHDENLKIFIWINGEKVFDVHRKDSNISETISKLLKVKILQKWMQNCSFECNGLEFNVSLIAAAVNKPCRIRFVSIQGRHIERDINARVKQITSVKSDDKSFIWVLKINTSNQLLMNEDTISRLIDLSLENFSEHPDENCPTNIDVCSQSEIQGIGEPTKHSFCEFSKLRSTNSPSKIAAVRPKDIQDIVSQKNGPKQTAIPNTMEYPPPQPRSLSKINIKKWRIIAQVDQKFIVCRLDHEIFLIDQHAADERCRLEHTLASFFVNDPISSRLEEDVVIDNLTEDENRKLQFLNDNLSRFGFKFIFDDGGNKKCSLTHVNMLFAQRFKFRRELLYQMLIEHLGLSKKRSNITQPAQIEYDQYWRHNFTTLPRVLFELSCSIACRSKNCLFPFFFFFFFFYKPIF